LAELKMATQPDRTPIADIPVSDLREWEELAAAEAAVQRQLAAPHPGPAEDMAVAAGTANDNER
jgi:hypothetical protein